LRLSRSGIETLLYCDWMSLPTYNTIHAPIPEIPIHIDAARISINKTRPIVANSLEKADLLVKVVRRRDGTMKRKEVVAFINKEYRFIALADYQYPESEQVKDFIQDRMDFKCNRKTPKSRRENNNTQLVTIRPPINEDYFAAPKQFTPSVAPNEWNFKLKTPAPPYVPKKARHVTITAMETMPQKLAVADTEITDKLLAEIAEFQKVTQIVRTKNGRY
jgi:hypothetical protein